MKNEKMLLGLLGCVFGLAVAASACSIDGTIVNPEYCWNAEGDATCEAKYPGEGLFCSNETSPCMADGKYGCVAERPELDECYSPCGGQESVLTNSGCTDVADEVGSGESSGSGGDSGSGESSSSGEDSDSTGMACECASDADCSGDALLCHNECECVECTADAGAACASQWLACDVDTFTCESCTGCAEQLCNYTTGQCLGDAVHVDGDGGQEFDSLQAAIASLGGSGTIILHEVEGMNTYSLVNDDFVGVGAGQTLSIVAAPDEQPRVDYTDADETGHSGFEVSGGSLYLAGFEIVGERGVLVEADGQVQLVSMSVKTDKSALVVSVGRAYLANSILRTDLANNSRPTVEVLGDSQLEATFTTIVGVGGTHAALKCEMADAVNVRNSLLGTINMTDAIDCPALSLAGGYVEDPLLLSMESTWFTDEYLHLDAQNIPETLKTSAQRSAGDPSVDIDGDPRPLEAPTYAGADVP